MAKIIKKAETPRHIFFGQISNKAGVLKFYLGPTEKVSL
jgi:hypothetical protein